MANTVIALKKSATPSAAPTNLANGELAINYADGKLYYKAANGTISSISGNEPNYFGTVNANNTLVVADTPGDILTFVPGTNISIVGDAVNDRVTISLKDTVVIPGDTTVGKLIASAVGGDEGGEILLEKPPSGILDGGITIDAYKDKIRIFEQGGSARGVYINLASASAGVGTDLLASSSGTDSIARAAAGQAFDKANTANQTADLAFNKANTANITADRAWNHANAGYAFANSIAITANLAFAHANAAFANGNTTIQTAQSAFTQANLAFIHANNAFASANAGQASANAGQATANAAFNRANTANITADRAWNHANAAFITANIAFANANTVMISAQAAFTVANSSFLHSNAAYAFANSITVIANLAFAHANAAHATANAAYDKANSTTYTSNVVISVTDNTNAALRITQTGTGHAILVEDDANPDSTPFVVSNTGNVGIGTTDPGSPLTIKRTGLGSGSAGAIKIISVVAEGTSPLPYTDFEYYGTIDGAPTHQMRFKKAMGNSAYPTIIGANRPIGRIASQSHDGVSFYDSTLIRFTVDGTPAINSTPGAIEFYTTRPGSTTLGESMRIASSGNVLIGRFTDSTVGSGVKLDIAGAANASNLLVNGNMVFTAANDGAGSNLDADLLDGQQGSYYGIATDVTAAFLRANTANITADRAWNHANAAFASANIAFANANTVMISAQAAFTVANSGFIHANSGYAFANSIAITANLAFAHANLAFANGNTVIQTAQSAFNQANLAFIHANNAFASANAGQASGNAAQSTANAAFNRANTANITADRAWNHANAAFASANIAFANANTVMVSAQAAFTVANSGFLHANSGYAFANSIAITTNLAFAHANLAFANGNTVIQTAQSAFNQANLAFIHANNAFASANAGQASANAGQSTANAAFARANTANITADRAWNHANAAFDVANTSGVEAEYAFLRANLAHAHANASYAFANSAHAIANLAFAHANAAFLSSNGVNTYTNSTYVKLTASSQTITGDLDIVGTLTLSGNTVFIDATRLQIDDPLIYLAGNNYTSDIVDIGFIANYVNATGQNVHTGLYREHENKEYYLFQGYDKEPANNHIGAFSNNMTLAVLNADIRTSNIILGGANAILTIGAAFNVANTSGVEAEYAFLRANLAHAHANAAHASANAGMAIANGAFASANAGQSTANAAFNKANTANITADRAWNHANAAFAVANSALPSASYTAADVLAKLITVDGAGTNLDADLLDGQQGSYYGISTDVSAANRVANAAFLHANAAFIAANADYAFSNSAHNIANLAFTHANAAFTKANSALANATGTFSGDLTLTGDLYVNGDQIYTSATSSRTKIHVYSAAPYAIGMQSGITFGGLNDWGMTFQFNNDADRGFWWGHDSHTVAQGAMALTTGGKLTVANSIRVGFGESDSTDPGTNYTLEVNGSFAAQTKSFVINHPTKDDMKLRYGSLEGPENGVYVRGRVQGPYIYLPDYWLGLVDRNSITVSLTPIAKTEMPSVLSYNNEKIVLHSNSSIDCFYHVFAERKDVDKLVVEF